MLSVCVDETSSKSWIDPSKIPHAFNSLWSSDALLKSFDNIVDEINIMPTQLFDDLTNLYADEFRIRMEHAAARGLLPSGQAKVITKTMSRVMTRINEHKSEITNRTNLVKFEAWVKKVTDGCATHIKQ